MVSRVGPEEFTITLKFGAGLNTRTPEDEIGEREAADGQNFLLDVRNSALRNRKPFDLLGTAPNYGSINGGGSLLTAGGTVAAFIQAGDTVYKWDGSDFVASPVLDTVNASAKLRGNWWSHNFQLDGKVIVTDLALAEVVKEWDGTTWQDVTFTDESGGGFGNFFAKYCSVENERAIFSNVKSVSATPHLIVGSARSSYTQITTVNRPSSALGDADPWFLITPDLRPVNGQVGAFGTAIFSTEKGQLFKLDGSGPSDFAIDAFYPGSGASGNESLAYIGTDIIYGRMGRIESLRDTDRFGNSEADDITIDIADRIETYTGWTIVYNSRLNRVYCFPTGVSEVWVFQTAMRGGNVSPWMRWVTSHALAFQPTFAQSMLDPADGLEYVFLGDDEGNLYRMEGTGSSGDGGTSEIKTVFLSRMFTVPVDSEAYEIEGTIKYRKNETTNVSLQFEYSGQKVFNEAISVTLPAAGLGSFYNNDTYYSDGAYYGATFRNRMSRQKFSVAGRSDSFQVRVVVTGSADFTNNEIKLRFKAVS